MYFLLKKENQFLAPALKGKIDFLESARVRVTLMGMIFITPLRVWVKDENHLNKHLPRHFFRDLHS
jgi:hypothetical protein